MRLILALAFAATLFASDGSLLYHQKGCYGCHGSDARGIGDYPPLAGKPAGYLAKKLRAYREGSISSNRSDMMRPYAKNLTDTEIEAIARYLSELSVTESSYYEEYDLSDAM